MELVARIFETLGITSLTFLQMGLVFVLVVILSVTLIQPILATFQERENRTVKPVEEARLILAEAEAKAREYDEALRKASTEVFAAKRKKIEEAARAERKRIDAAIAESNRQIEEMKARIADERSAAARVLREEVRRLSAAIAEKVLGRQLA
jgi:F0F1-type ATP synthase membrane subunit b/b'